MLVPVANRAVEALPGRIAAQWHRERPDLDTEPMAVFGRIYRLSRAMGDRIEQVYARFGIGRGEFDVLAALRRSGEPFSLSPTSLAGHLRALLSALE